MILGVIETGGALPRKRTRADQPQESAVQGGILQSALEIPNGPFSESYIDSQMAKPIPKNLSTIQATAQAQRQQREREQEAERMLVEAQNTTTAHWVANPSSVYGNSILIALPSQRRETISPATAAYPAMPGAAAPMRGASSVVPETIHDLVMKIRQR